MSKKILLIDYSVFMHQSWHQMFGDNYLRKFDTELEEYSLNLMRNLWYLKCRIQPDEIILCLDDKTNWRKKFIEKYYNSRLNLIKDNGEGLKHETWYSIIDKTIYKFEKFLETMQWRTSTPNKKELEELDFTNPRFSHITDENLVKAQEVWDSCLLRQVPYYKAHRSYIDWKGITPKEDWKRFSFDQAKNIAAVLKASILHEKYAEGDDLVAGSLFTLSAEPDNEIVIASTDRDLYQLKLDHLNTSFYNPVEHKFMPVTVNEAKFKLLCKIAGGDGSDNINGVVVNGKRLVEVTFTKDGSVKNGKTTVAYLNKKIDESISLGYADCYKSAYSELEKLSEDDTFYKNLCCVYLKNIPEQLLNRIEDKVINRNIVDNTNGVKLSDFGITQIERVSIMNNATQDAKSEENNDA